MGPASIHLGGLQNGLGTNVHPTNEECGIREVWAHNMEEEFKTICQVCFNVNVRNVDVNINVIRDLTYNHAKCK